MSGWGAAAAGAIDALKGGQAKNDQIELNERQMQYQTKMSNTAHQRQAMDLKAAGLNPILSSNSGASAPAGNAGGAQQSPSAIDIETQMENIKNVKANTALAEQNKNLNLPKEQLAVDTAKAYREAKKGINHHLGNNDKNNNSAKKYKWYEDDPNSGWLDNLKNKAWGKDKRNPKNSNHRTTININKGAHQ